MSDELTELPEGWCYILLKNLGELKRGKSKHRPRNDPKLYGDFVPFIQTGEVARSGGRISSFSKMYSELGVQQSRIFPKGTICITIAANIADTGILGFDACFPDSIVGLITDDRLADSYFIEYFLRTIREDLAQFAPATAQANINIEILNKVFVPLPPIQEQKRIVAKIEELNDRTQKAKEALESIPQLCDRFRQSVLAAAFRGDLTADWREQNPDVEPASVLLERIKRDRRQRWEEEEFAKLKASGTIRTDEKWKSRYKEPETINSFNLPELPHAWSWASVEHLADVGTGATPLRNEPKYYENGIIPWITSGALNNLFIDKAEEFITPIAIQETNAKIFPKNTLLVAMYGEGKTRGKVAELLIEAATNQACAALILGGLASKIQPLVKLFFQKNYTDIRKLASGGVQPNLNLSMIKSTFLPIPPLQEQVEIIQVVSRLMSMIEIVEKQYQYTGDKLHRLNQSILAKAFRGELVPQDPDDEPASVLLERIRAKREKLNNSKPKSDRISKRKIAEGQGVIPGLD
ncbi:MAG: restriction endonuclease subunit S [Nostoc sp.]|uniref:restriction endonuclease subunit S n=1 Tax=Nostoc sp. TaxID=1180 RepID=UPI002FF3A2BC